jgi:magnesium transporter
MIEVHAYSAGKIHQQPLETLNLVRSVAWIDVIDPTMQDLSILKKKFNIPLTELRHALDMKERPRIKATRDYTFIIFGSHVKEGGYASAPVGLFLTKRYVLSIHADKIPALQDIDIKSDIFLQVMHRGTSFLLYTLLFRMIKGYFTPLEKIEDDVESLEERVIDHYSPQSSHQISSLKRKLVYLLKTLRGDHDVVTSLIRTEPMIKDKRMFEDLNIELLQLIGEVDLFLERLNTSLDIYLTAMSNRLNEVMKSFTVLASLLLLPMLVTGLYGMNVALPFQGHPHAFWMIVLFMGLIIIAMLTIFHFKKWT